MVVLSFLVASFLLVTPAAGGNVLLREVETVEVSTNWVPLGDGNWTRIEGTFHNATLLLKTNDPAVYRIVMIVDFRGEVDFWFPLNWKWFDPIGLHVEYDLSHVRLEGTVRFDDGGMPVLIDGTVLVRIRASLTFEYKDPKHDLEDVYQVVDLLEVARVQDGEIDWVRTGLPMGRPLQP